MTLLNQALNSLKIAHQGCSIDMRFFLFWVMIYWAVKKLIKWVMIYWFFTGFLLFSKLFNFFNIFLIFYYIYLIKERVAGNLRSVAFY